MTRMSKNNIIFQAKLKTPPKSNLFPLTLYIGVTPFVSFMKRYLIKILRALWLKIIA